jgi:hypothetical protein
LLFPQATRAGLNAAYACKSNGHSDEVGRYLLGTQLGVRILTLFLDLDGAGRGRGGSGSTQTQWLGNGRRKECFAVWGCCQYIDARLWAVGGGQSSWGGCCALLASWHRAISRAYCGTTSLRPGPLAVQLMALAASDATLQTAVRGARMGSAAVPVTCDLLPVWLWSRLDCTLLVC